MAVPVTEALVRRLVRVSGVVQGVGFRPFVHALAMRCDLGGEVGNDASGVFIDVEGRPADVEEFLVALVEQAPALAVVEHVSVVEREPIGQRAFHIVESRQGHVGDVALIPPDTAICDDCLREVLDPHDRRHRYPFTACTYCGPRYTIVRGLPYDRPFTTMAAFPLCDECAVEYDDPADRRFHAQPTACPVCGPSLSFRDVAATSATSSGEDALADAVRALRAGEILAVKGVGGYHLVCDAYDASAVSRLRERKGRGEKPFAVMARTLEVAGRLAAIDGDIAAALLSPQAPIVLAPAQPRDDRHATVIDAVAPGVGTIGAMLPYTALHHLVMAAHPLVDDAPLDLLVVTSGNLSDEPLCIDVDDADHRLAPLADAFLHHDRAIHVPCDDSVVRVVDGRLQPVRRSRGYAPLPVALPLEAPATVAVGGELKTTVCLAVGRRAWMSQHVGDTENLETLEVLERTVATLGELTRVQDPQVVVADAHPGYLSRRWAEQHAEAIGAELVLVQHHHAHLASLLAEHGVPGDEAVLGVVLDGTGWGLDETIWGGELLLGGYREVRRVGHLSGIALPGGDAAVRRPARTALAHLHAAGVAWDPDLVPVAAADDRERAALASMLRSGFGCTPTTSMGRLFDAVSSLLGLRQDTRYEGQAAMELEAAAAGVPPVAVRIPVRDEDGVLVLDAAEAIRDVVAGLRSGAPPAGLAAGFQDAVVRAVGAAALAARAAYGVTTVGLTGGVFQNAALTSGCRGTLEQHGFQVLVHRSVPPNDGGLALGQVAVAAAGGGRRGARSDATTERND